MQIEVHKRGSRGFADYGWLKTSRSFSFDNYYNPDRMGFGRLRVLNDDWVAPEGGFPKHPHRDMEIVSIPLLGDLEHKDSMGNVATIREGEIQVMSAGTGVFHSEYNPSSESPTVFLQLWMFPRSKGLQPRYQQMLLPDLNVEDTIHTVVHPESEKGGLWVYQDAWISLATLTEDSNVTYNMRNKNNGVYAFVISGSLVISDSILEERDGAAIVEADHIEIKSQTGARVLLIEVPL